MSKTNRDERPSVNRGEREEPENRQATEAQQDTLRADALPYSSEELEALLRQEALANALPNPPAIPGYHQVSLSTTNTYTPIQQYVRLGYVPVRREEHPQWNYLKQHSAEMPGDGIACNEMVLYKIADEAYQHIMRHIHHDRPNEEEERLKANIRNLKEGDDFRDSDGKSLVQEEGDGFKEMLEDRTVRRAPTFR